MRYNKPPLTYSQQVALLQKRGLIVPDTSKAEGYLSRISYYRFSAYFLPFQKVKDTFNPGTTFDQVLDLYTFDREFRLLVFDAIERIEIAIRTQMIYHMSHRYGSHWQDNASVFKPPSIHPVTGDVVNIFADIQTKILKSCQAKHPEAFIKHYFNTYTSPNTPPGWMGIELLTIGDIYSLYNALSDNIDKQAIATFFCLPQIVFSSWLHTLVYVRNICAHHSRLWNRELAIAPLILQNPRQSWIAPAFNTNNNRTFYLLCMLRYLLIGANPRGHFRQKWENLMLKYPDIPIQYMGIPTDASGKLIDWKTQPLWMI